jgi:hypothetical protein
MRALAPRAGPGEGGENVARDRSRPGGESAVFVFGLTSPLGGRVG